MVRALDQLVKVRTPSSAGQGGGQSRFRQGLRRGRCLRVLTAAARRSGSEPLSSRSTSAGAPQDLSDDGHGAVTAVITESERIHLSPRRQPAAGLPILSGLLRLRVEGSPEEFVFAKL